MVRVVLEGVLTYLAGRRELEVEASTVRELVERLREFPKLYQRVRGKEDGLSPDIYIAVNDVDIRLLSGLDTQLREGDVVLILAYIHGG
ncbi:MAG: MoaD/ThiS family protein [Thermoproteus sp.]|nr:MoaD/ThiS family protein [Thermoproteus sp.]MDT7882965.1 MoaD/ThiS family protein [Thermoproteus sp.]